MDNNQVTVTETQAQILWRLHYRQGPNPMPMHKLFYSASNLPDVIQRCKAHCATMNFRFIDVREAISDLAEDERKQLS